MRIRIDYQVKLFRAAQIGLPLAVVFGIGGVVMGLCATAIVAAFILWEYQTRPLLCEKADVTTSSSTVQADASKVTVTLKIDQEKASTIPPK